nr:NBS-containing resistance-like protein [Tanacetum cinerariifolium]
MVTHSKVGIVKKNPKFACHISISSSIPRSHIHALRDPNRQHAMLDEYNALISNDGSLSRYKARLIANGRSQQEGIDCDDANTLLLALVSKQNIVAFANAVVETAWVRSLLHELLVPLRTTTLFYCDNVSAVYSSCNPVQHQRTKHIEIDINYVCEFVSTGYVRVLHVPSRYQFADIFIKVLPLTLFDEFRSSLTVRPPPAPTAGAY